MDNSLLMVFTALLFFAVQGTNATVEVNKNNHSTIIPPTNATPITHISPTQSKCQNYTTNITLPPVLGMIKFSWREKRPCEGQLFLSLVSSSALPLCFKSDIHESWWNEVCRNRRCGNFESFKHTSQSDSYRIAKDMTVTRESCQGLLVICQALPDNQGRELVAYKTVTGILLFFIIAVVLLQFSRPTYKAFRKRFSQKRQSRWIGPTQSQSVSYHRGQGHPNNNTVKSQSFPGLERLTVNASREPSSNRNSDYDSYGCN